MRKRLQIIPAGTLLLALVMSGCSSDLPSPDPSPAAISQPVLTAGQVEQSVQRVSLALDEADVARDPALLEGNLTGPAAAIRAAQYVVADATKDDEVLTALPAEIQTAVVSTNDQWPRDIFVITEQPENLEPQRIVALRQETARQNYQMWGWVRLFPSVEVPAFAQVSEGSEQIAPDSQAATKIDEILDHYVDVLNKQKNSSWADEFTSDMLQETIVERRTALTKALKPIDGSYKYVVTRPEGAQAQPTAWRTADGGILVMAALEATEQAEGPQGSSITPDEAAQALLGKTKVKNKLYVDRQIVIALVIPPETSSDPYAVVGAENVRIAARIKK